MKKYLYAILFVTPVFCTALSSYAEEESIDFENQKVSDIFSPDKETFWGGIWEKLKLKVKLDMVDQEYIHREYAQGFSASFEAVSKPAFIKDYHQRLDIWSARINLGYNDSFNIGTMVSTRITFSRLFKSKSDSIVMPYLPTKVPFNSKDAKSKLVPGDAVRFEFSSNPYLGASHSESLNSNTKWGVGLNFYRGAYFLVDLYRIKDNRMRLRMIANRSRLDARLNVGLSATDYVDLGLGFLNSSLKRLFSCSPVRLSTTTNVFEKTPVDSMMADYVFDLNRPEGEKAFNELMQELIHLEYLKYLNFIYNHEKLGDLLNRQLEKIDQYFKKELHLSPEHRSVHRVFKGRTVTDFRSLELDSNCFRLWDFTLFSIRNASTDVRTYDEQEVPHDYNYYSASTNNKFTYVSNLYGTGQQFTANTLFNGERIASGSNKIKVRPTSLSDLIITRQFLSLDHTSEDMGHIKNYLKYTTPTYAKDIKWGQFDLPHKKNNAYFQVRWVFDPQFVSQISSLLAKNATQVLKSRLEHYIDRFPRKEYLPAPNENDHMKQEWYGRYDMDIQIISEDLTIAFLDQKLDRRVEALLRLQTNELFQYIGPGFLLSLIPHEQVENFVNFRLLAGAHKTDAISFEAGAPGPTNIYSSVEYILAAINDKQFDLRLQLNENGAPYNCLLLDPKEKINCRK